MVDNPPSTVISISNLSGFSIVSNNLSSLPGTLPITLVLRSVVAYEPIAKRLSVVPSRFLTMF